MKIVKDAELYPSDFAVVKDPSIISDPHNHHLKRFDTKKLLSTVADAHLLSDNDLLWCYHDRDPMDKHCWMFSESGMMWMKYSERIYDSRSCRVMDLECKVSSPCNACRSGAYMTRENVREFLKRNLDKTMMNVEETFSKKRMMCE